MVRVLGITGSLRRDSWNLKLLKVALDVVAGGCGVGRRQALG